MARTSTESTTVGSEVKVNRSCPAIGCTGCGGGRGGWGGSGGGWRVGQVRTLVVFGRQGWRKSLLCPQTPAANSSSRWHLRALPAEPRGQQMQRAVRRPMSCRGGSTDPTQQGLGGGPSIFASSFGRSCVSLGAHIALRLPTGAVCACKLRLLPVFAASNH